MRWICYSVAEPVRHNPTPSDLALSLLDVAVRNIYIDITAN